MNANQNYFPVLPHSARHSPRGWDLFICRCLCSCLTMLAVPLLSVHTGLGCRPLRHGILAFSPADPLLQPSRHLPRSFREATLETYIPKSKRASSGLKTVMLTVCILFLISRSPLFQQAGGHMWSNEEEEVRTSFFLFFNWILGPKDEMSRLQLEKLLSTWVEGFWEEPPVGKADQLR